MDAYDLCQHYVTPVDLKIAILYHWFYRDPSVSALNIQYMVQKITLMVKITNILNTYKTYAFTMYCTVSTYCMCIFITDQTFICMLSIFYLKFKFSVCFILLIRFNYLCSIVFTFF